MPKRCFRLYRQPNRALVRSIESGSCLGVFERARYVSGTETKPPSTLNEICAQRCQSTLFRLRPERVNARERLTAEKSKRLLEKRLLLLSHRRRLGLRSDAIELLDVN